MNKVLLSACIIAVISLNACGEQAEYDNSLPMFPSKSTSPAVPADTSKPFFTDTANGPFTTIDQQPLPSIPEQFTPKSTAALNPKHGSPGHRCDIAVGAPLNSTAQPAQQNAPVIQTLPAQPKALPKSGGTVKLNPAHGQPGHDCAIAVGKPLKG